MINIIVRIAKRPFLTAWTVLSIIGMGFIVGRLTAKAFWEGQYSWSDVAAGGAATIIFCAMMAVIINELARLYPGRDSKMR